ncbi:MAG TPA: NADH-quinone oxidoreductase subunit G [Gammaproteobacteria bacterium]|nr:NADH-quinone oxidoreductase subunit G [Gammaproteobacteria bacterium]
MSDDKLNIEIDGTSLKANPGEMLIAVADKAGIRIPRFCYHNKLSVAANCRMCLVEVEKAPKPLPACATPVMDGMKVFTKSPRAIAAQKATMEFLLINHPLDCPICDQGGECELQDVAMGYGGDISRFSEDKRVVPDKNLGPLIATDMTRCIHCTRCVRFGQELAGVREMGATGRGEHTRIGTYIEQAVDSEMSGNIIDLCPVGALTAKPSRFSARAWELVQSPSIAAHDCMGSNISIHTFRGEVTRVGPRDNENINECWLSDRDRFSYEGLRSDSRLKVPMIRINDEWKETDWDTALEIAAKGIKSAGSDLGILVSSSSTLEEMALARQIADGTETRNIDHRLRQIDFRDQDNAPVFPGLGQKITDLENCDAALLIGSNVSKEQPIAAHRLRKASMRGAKLMFVNSRDFACNLNVEEKIIVSPGKMIHALAGIAKSAMDLAGSSIPGNLQHLFANVDSSDSQLAITGHLKAADSATVIIGSQAQLMPYLAEIRSLAGVIAQATGATLGYLTEGTNTAGACLSGVLPNRDAGGTASRSKGRHAMDMMENGMAACLLVGVEPELDMADATTAVSTLKKTDCVVSLTAYLGDAMKEYANVLLPVTPVSETSGTFINIEGTRQSFTGVTKPLGESRPAWKVLRVLGNLLDLEGFDFNSSEEVRDEVLARIGDVEMNNHVGSDHEVRLPVDMAGLTRIGAVAIYHEDSVVRRATALQATHDALEQGARIHSGLADKLGLGDADKVLVSQGGDRVSVPLVIDDGIPEDCVWLPIGTPAGVNLSSLFASLEMEAD